MNTFFLLLLSSLLLSHSHVRAQSLPDLSKILTPCERALVSVFRGEYQNSALIVNAMGKGVGDLGNFDDCMVLNATNYCLLKATIEPMPILLGWCVPDVCDGVSLKDALDTLLRKNISDIIGVNVALKISVIIAGFETASQTVPLTAPPNVPPIDVSCKASNAELSTGACVVIFVLSLFAFSVLAASLLDCYLPETHSPVPTDFTSTSVPTAQSSSAPDHLDDETEDEDDSTVALKDTIKFDIQQEETKTLTEKSDFLKRDNFGIKLLLSFSILRNFNSLTAKDRSPNTQFLNGLRVLSMLYVMLGHTNAFMLFVPIMDLYTVYMKIWKKLSFQFITGGFFAVDSFYFLSGLLGCLAILELLKKEKLNWALVYFHRWWRLTPLYFVLIWVWTYLSPYFIEGPLAYSNFGESGEGFLSPAHACDNYWWTNILYINNFIPWDENLTKGCMSWGWYLSNDMQFFVITPLFLWIYQKNQKGGTLLIGGLLAMSLVVVGILVKVNDVKFGDDNWTNLIYVKPWLRFAPYMLGVMLALLWKKQGTVKISSAILIIAYLSSALILLLTIYGTYTNMNDEGWGPTENFFYFTFSHAGFVVGLVIISYLMLNGYATYITKFLSLDLWTPLARLTFGCYLVHPIVMICAFSSTRHALNWDIWTIIIYFTGFSLLSYAASLILYLLIEKPFANIEKEIIIRATGKQELL